MPSPLSLSSLFTRLVAKLGHRDASNELRWLTQSLPTPTDNTLLRDLLLERAQGKPLQYILGNVPFGHLTMKVRPPTLIPRPETEEWTLRLADSLPSRVPPQVWKTIDLCTGTGCIPLLLAASLPQAKFDAVAVDISGQACQLAMENAELLHGGHSSLKILHSDITTPAFLSQFEPNSFHILTSNPPYIPYEQYVRLPRSVKDYEDPRALLGDADMLLNAGQPPATENDGLQFYALIATLIPHLLLKQGSICALEVGMGQAPSVKSIVQKTQFFTQVDTWTDAAGIGRTIVATN